MELLQVNKDLQGVALLQVNKDLQEAGLLKVKIIQEDNQDKMGKVGNNKMTYLQIFGFYGQNFYMIWYYLMFLFGIIS